MTRASLIPGATHSGSTWYADNFGGAAMNVDGIVVHTTETSGLPGYDGGAMAPTATAVPSMKAEQLRWVQHFPFETSARALRNLIGGSQTNTADVAQVELVGTCDPRYRKTWGKLRAGADYIYWPDAPDWALRELGEFLAWAYREHAVPLVAPQRFLPYPQSYGQTSVRMTSSEWARFRGICGHQHVPENVHGDPGDLDVTRAITHARAILAKASAASADDDPRKLLHLQPWLRGPAGRIEVGDTGDAAGALNRYLGYGSRTLTTKTLQGVERALTDHDAKAMLARVREEKSVGRGIYEFLAALSRQGVKPYN